jgi:hypothetical protein
VAGITQVTQQPTTATVTTGFSTEVGQVATAAYVYTSFKTFITQVSAVAYTWSAFATQITQAPTTAWVITCESSSYVPPASSGLVTLTATAGATDERWVDVGWTALEGFTFTLERGTASGVYDTTLLTGSTATSFHDTAVDFHVTYYYRVTGTNVCGDETASNEGSATLSCTLPLTPMGFVAVAGQLPHQVILRWTVLDGLTYEIQRNNVTLASGLTEIPYIDSDVPSGFVQYSLSALNDCGWGEDAAHITIRVPGCTPWSGAVVPCTGWKSRM